jgi:hypothetical protein
MADRKAAEGEIADLQYWPLHQRNKLERNWRPSLPPEACEHPHNDLERACAAMDSHRVVAAAQPQSREETWNAQNMIEVGVS